MLGDDLRPKIERKQAQAFAVRIIHAEQLHDRELARMFGILLNCCEQKIQITKAIEDYELSQELALVVEVDKRRRNLSTSPAIRNPPA